MLMVVMSNDKVSAATATVAAATHDIAPATCDRSVSVSVVLADDGADRRVAVCSFPDESTGGGHYDVFLHVDKCPLQDQPAATALHHINKALETMGTSVRLTKLQFATVFPITRDDDNDKDPERDSGGVIQAQRGDPHSPSSSVAGTKVDSTAGAASAHLDWLFFAVLKPNELDDVARACRCRGHEVALLPEVRLSASAYALSSTPWLARAIRSFHPLVAGLLNTSKKTVPSFTTALDELLDYHIVDPCLYVFDNPGKGVRSKSIKALADNFQIHPHDLKSLMQSVDRFHELSLVIDDIEDHSTLRRDRPCAHLKFGIPATLNSAYFLTFKLIDSVPRLFRRHHNNTIRLLIDGTVRAHRGQGLEIYWRDNQYCPTADEYVEMVKGKTSTPFVLSCQLFFLHSTDWRVRLSSALVPPAQSICNMLGLSRFAREWLQPLHIEQRMTALFEDVGVFFQVRDDPVYWLKKGFCDDIHERKFSYPIIHMIQNRLRGYEGVLRLFYAEQAPSFDEITQALETIQQTEALQHTFDYLVALRKRIDTEARALQIQALLSLLERLSFSPPDRISTDVIEQFRPCNDNGTAKQHAH
ncbi:hypothetical protein PTSG_04558 [Salpingoeca rosetta]|uniref:Uncharacterized protein n=1 Tax=Salpingoeca rosetta (strain ATCC 50818 / BSB-021) TaxID=946362 RepID=F2U7S4_SALR5|nr:uncharacterized protein PTSG_04558 [Salpingoeca rosetta]EGD72829.1 hypothetical protein PTSG_04558 [Salpingoeca rosetta]|eukprot:XP_004994652.1 hypothetical protein PTSG_04558 [Salpingoeca rosetta]